MLIYILSLLICLYILTTFGLAMQQFSNKNGAYTSGSFFDAFLFGLILMTAVSAYTSVFLPIPRYSILIVGFLSVVIHWWLKIDVRSKIAALIAQKRDIAFLSAIFLFVAFIAADGINHFDSGLYHIQAMNWIQSYRVIPGLGNLHGRLAFNTLFFPVSTLFSFNGTIGQVELLMFPLNAAFLFSFLGNRYFLVKSALAAENYPKLIYALALPLVGLMYIWNAIGSPTPDIPVALLTILVLERLWSTKIDTNTRSYYTIVAFIFTAIAYKLSSLLLALALIPLLVNRWQIKNKIWGDLFKTALLASLLLAPFFIRNYYLSGYVVYPFAQLDVFEVDWKIPAALVIEEKSWVTSWAKIPGPHFEEVIHLDFSSWFPIWLGNQNPVTLFALLASIFTSLICLFSPRKEVRQVGLGLIFLANFLFWLLNAPDPRFAHGLLLFGVAFFLFHLSHMLVKRIKSSQKVILVTLICLLPSAFLGYKSLVTAKHYASHSSQILIPKSMELSKHELKIETRQTNFQYFVPLIDDRCYNQDIPCTPYPKEGLRLRGSELSSGFRIVD